VNLWMKRAIGVAALGGGLLALSAGAASAQEISADATARLGRPTSAEVRVCADGRVLSRLLGCTDRAGGTAQTGSGEIRARARVPRVVDADVSIGTRRGRPGTTASGQASATRRARAAAAADTSPSADATASLSRPRAGRLLEAGPLASLAGVGLLGSSPFTLVGDPATGSLLPVGELTLDSLAGETPAGIGVLESGPIASGNQVDADAGDISASIPVTVCGNGVGVLGDASANCGTAGTSAGPAASGSAGASAGTSGSGNQVEASVDDVSATMPVTACGNSVGLLGDASASCGAGGGTAPGTDAGVDLDTILDAVLDTGTGGTTDPGAGVGIGVEVGIGGDISTGGIIAPTPPGTTPGTTPGRTDTVGTPGSGSTGTSGIPGTLGLTPGGAGAGTAFAPLRGSVSGPGALPFTGAGSDLLALFAFGLLAAGALFVRATRPAAATEGGGNR
jgi:hypothetical protein